MFKREVCGADVHAEFDRREFGLMRDIFNDNGNVRLQIMVEAVKAIRFDAAAGRRHAARRSPGGPRVVPRWLPWRTTSGGPPKYTA